MTRVHGARFPEYDAGFRVQGAARWTPLLLLETERAVGVQTCTLYQYCDRRETNRHGITSLGLQGRGTTPTRRVSCDVLPSACSFLSKPGSFTRRAITLYTLSSEQIIVIHLTSLFLCSHTRENQTNALKTYCLVYSAYPTTYVAYSTTDFHLPLFPHRPLSFPPPCPILPPSPPRAQKGEGWQSGCTSRPAEAASGGDNYHLPPDRVRFPFVTALVRHETADTESCRPRCRATLPPPHPHPPSQCARRQPILWRFTPSPYAAHLTVIRVSC